MGDEPNIETNEPGCFEIAGCILLVVGAIFSLVILKMVFGGGMFG